MPFLSNEDISIHVLTESSELPGNRRELRLEVVDKANAYITSPEIRIAIPDTQISAQGRSPSLC
jgi:hypothetical protein